MELPELMTLQEVAEALKISQRAARHLGETKILKTCRVGKKFIRFYRDDVAEFLRGGGYKGDR